MGVVGPKRRTTSVEMPASCGVHGPGEMMMWLGASAATSSSVISSLRRTTASAPQLAHVAGEVVDERVAVVEDAGSSRRRPARRSWPRDLVERLAVLLLGSESATIPPPALKYMRPSRTTAVRMAMLVSISPVMLQ